MKCTNMLFVVNEKVKYILTCVNSQLIKYASVFGCIARVNCIQAPDLCAIFDVCGVQILLL